MRCYCKRIRNQTYKVTHKNQRKNCENKANKVPTYIISGSSKAKGKKWSELHAALERRGWVEHSAKNRVRLLCERCARRCEQPTTHVQGHHLAVIHCCGGFGWLSPRSQINHREEQNLWKSSDPLQQEGSLSFIVTSITIGQAKYNTNATLFFRLTIFLSSLVWVMQI